MARGTAAEPLRDPVRPGCSSSARRFHYLGPSFAVLLFVRLEPIGVAWLRILSAAAFLALWPTVARMVRGVLSARQVVVLWGAPLAVPDARIVTLPRFLLDHIEPGAVVATDGLAAYRKACGDGLHPQALV